MFETRLEALENSFLLVVIYELRMKRWAYRTLEDLIVHRARLEHYFAENDTETLKEEML